MQSKRQAGKGKQATVEEDVYEVDDEEYKEEEDEEEGEQIEGENYEALSDDEEDEIYENSVEEDKPSGKRRPPPPPVRATEPEGMVYGDVKEGEEEEEVEEEEDKSEDDMYGEVVTDPLDEFAWYHGNMTRDEAVKKLKSRRADNSFLVRKTTGKETSYTINVGCINDRREFETDKLIVVQEKEKYFFQTLPDYTFDTMEELVGYYSDHPLKTRKIKLFLTNPIK